MRADSQTQDKRERAIHRHLVAVHEAVAAWAKGSANGALVWQIADQNLPGLWDWWDLLYKSTTWYVPRDLVAEFNELATMVQDDGVTMAVSEAVVALNNYQD